MAPPPTRPYRLPLTDRERPYLHRASSANGLSVQGVGQLPEPVAQSGSVTRLAGSGLG
jgi:hypothetical protein